MWVLLNPGEHHPGGMTQMAYSHPGRLFAKAQVHLLTPGVCISTALEGPPGDAGPCPVKAPGGEAMATLVRKQGLSE